METVTNFIFLGSKITGDSDCSHEIKWHLLLGRKAMTNLDSVLKSRDITLSTKVHYNQSYVFPSSHVQMWVLDRIEGWAAKNWCSQIVLLKTLENHLDCKEVKPINSKGNQSWIFIERTDAEDEAPIIWLHDAKNWLTGKDLNADWGQEEKGTTDDKMVGWHHWLNGHEFEQTLGDSEEQWSLECCSPWGCRELDMTEWLNNNAKSWTGSHTQRLSESNQGSLQVSKLFLSTYIS